MNNSNIPLGISIVIVTYNGEQRLPATLDYIMRQEVDPGIHWELVVVDNASMDDTVGITQRTWNSDISLRIIHEPKKGVAFVRIRGIEEAKYEFILFVDDDNRIAPDWVQRIFQIFTDYPEIGMLGGYNSGDFESPPPDWFESMKESFAIGPQGIRTGDITDSRGYVWGAGMAFRKSVFLRIQQCGFIPLLTSREDGKLAGGEDVELSYLFKMAGYRIWYFSDLKLSHFIPAHRFTWNYAVSLNKGAGENIFYLGLYTLSMNNCRWLFFRMFQRSITEFAYVILQYFRYLLNTNKHKQYTLLFYYSKSRLFITFKNILNYRSYYIQIDQLRKQINSIH